MQCGSSIESYDAEIEEEIPVAEESAVNTAGFLILALWLAPPCDLDTRADRWACERAAKSGQLEPRRPTAAESFLSRLERLRLGQDPSLDDAFGLAVRGGDMVPLRAIAGGEGDGLLPLVGDLSQESGFASGVGFRRQEAWNGRFHFRASAQWSVRKYQRYVVEAEMPRLFHDRLFLNLKAIQRNYPEQDYFGIGPDSGFSRRANFALDATDVGSAIGIRLAQGMRLQTFAGLLSANTGRGRDSSVPSIEESFTSSTAPGLHTQPDYGYLGVSFALDHRDDPDSPVSGGFYRFEWTGFRDRTLDRFSFAQYTAEARQYFPLFSPYRVFALRAMSVLTHTAPGNEVPYFMMGTLGGPETLRGFSNARFRDRNFVLMNAEYRWSVFSQMDAVLFADTGKVFPAAGRFRLNNLDTSYGFGARFKTPKGPLLRLEYGFSNENRRLTVVFRPAF